MPHLRRCSPRLRESQKTLLLKRNCVSVKIIRSPTESPARYRSMKGREKTGTQRWTLGVSLSDSPARQMDPEERRQLFELLRLHPVDVEIFVQNLLPVNPVPAPQTQPGPLRRDCETVVVASVLCGAVSANLPNFVCDSDDYFYGAQCDVDCSVYSDYDELDELDCYSHVHDCVDTADYYAPTDVDFMHELHGPNTWTGMRSDHMDIMHQRTVDFTMACMTR